MTGARSLAGGGYPSQRSHMGGGGHHSPRWRGGECITRYDTLCRGWYASCGFPQEDFLVGTGFVMLIAENAISHADS